MSSPNPLHGQRLWPLYMALITIGMGQTVVFAVLPMLGRELGLDRIVLQLPFSAGEWRPKELAITSLSALTALTYFFISPVWGRLSDKVGRKPIILIGLVGYGLGTLAFNGIAWVGLGGMLSGALLFGALLITRIFHASLMSATQPAASAYIVDVTTVSNRTRGIGRLAASNQLGSMIGPVLAWFAFISFLAPLYLQAVLCMFTALLVWIYLPALPPAPRPANSRKLRFFDPRFRLFLFVGLSLFLLMGMVQQTLGFYFQDVLQLTGARSAQLFSVAMVVSSMAMLAAQFGVVQRFSGHSVVLLFYGLPFCLAGYGTLAVAGTLPLLITGMALFGFGMGLAGPGYNAAATLVVEPHEQGALAGLMGAAASMGFVVGPLLGGYLYQFDPTQPYRVAAIGLAALLLVIAGLHKRLLSPGTGT